MIADVDSELSMSPREIEDDCSSSVYTAPENLSAQNPHHPRLSEIAEERNLLGSSSVPATQIANQTESLAQKTQSTHVPLVHSTSGILDGLAKQRSRLLATRPLDFSMLIVGASQIGKSSLVRTLFQDSWSGPLQVPEGSSGTVTSNGPVKSQEFTWSGAPSVPETLRNLPTIDRHRMSLRFAASSLRENGVTVNFTIAESAGFSDYSDSTLAWVPAANYIDEQHEHYMCQEEQPERGALRDRRVHVCIYMIAPTCHLLSELDISSMIELGQRSNLIPVIAKADALSVAELERFRELVARTIKDRGIEVYKPAGENTESTLYAPLAVVNASKYLIGPDGVLVPVREKLWQDIHVLDPQISDVTILRDILFRNNMFDLVMSTHERFYERSRTVACMARWKQGQETRSRAATGVTQPECPNQSEQLSADVGEPVNNAANAGRTIPENVYGAGDAQVQETTTSITSVDGDRSTMLTLAPARSAHSHKIIYGATKESVGYLPPMGTPKAEIIRTMQRYGFGWLRERRIHGDRLVCGQREATIAQWSRLYGFENARLLRWKANIDAMHEETHTERVRAEREVRALEAEINILLRSRA